MSDWTLCIDFGTAFSKAAAAPVGAWSNFEPGRVRPLVLSGADATGNAFLLDSAVFVDDDRVLFGRAAVERADALVNSKRMALRSFKTLLSVSDLDRALNANAPAGVDPHRVFQMRDLVVLYLAYLLASIDRAVQGDAQLQSATSISRRYAAPAWRAGDSAGMHSVIMRLFSEAEAFRQAAGEKLLAPQGMPLKKISDALPAAESDAQPVQMGLVYEATGAAAYTSIGLPDSGSHLIVVDMGAGTTDIAALAHNRGEVEELTEARVTLKQAGDFIDRIVANIVLDASKWARAPEEQADLWRLLMTHMRDIKESLFHDGRAVLRHDGRAINIAMRDVERDKDFKLFLKELTKAYEESLRIVRHSAAAQKRRTVQTIAVGGGASAPFIQDLLRLKPGGNVSAEPRPATPEWAYAPEFQGNLAPVFPQLAIAIGGALAPDSMLATSSGVSPAAGGRTGIRAERD